MSATDIAETVLDTSLEAVIESSIADLITELADIPIEECIIRGRHESDEGATPAIVVSATRKEDADITGYWYLDVEVSFMYRIGEVESRDAEYIFRQLDEVLGEGDITLKTRLADYDIAVAGVEYDNEFSFDRDEATETKIYAFQMIAGLYSPLST